MVKIRKRTWTTAQGETREGWQVDFVDQQGKRRHRQFARKKDADALAGPGAWSGGGRNLHAGQHVDHDW